MYSSSCRSCGGIMNATLYCATCKEGVSWECSVCEKLQDATHKH